MTETLATAPNWRATLLIGQYRHRDGSRALCPVEIEIEISPTPNGPQLSICGSVWYYNRRDCYACGQLRENIREYLDVLLIPEEHLGRILAVWNRWHLNGMRAGCEHQRAEGWNKRPIDPSKPLGAYGLHFDGQRQPSWNMLAWIPRAEHPEGLLCYPCPTCGYRYGSAWLYEPLPASIVAEVKSWAPTA